MPDELDDALFGDDVSDDASDEAIPTERVYVDEVIDPEKEEKAPTKKAGPRTSASSLITLVWGGMGTMLIRSETDVAVGRVLQFQAPLAGNKIDELIANTWVDTVLQPFVKQAEKVEGLGAIVLFPLLVGAYERNPAIGPMIESILSEVVSETLTAMAPVIKKKQAKEKAAAKSLQGLNEALNIPKDANPIDAVLASIFEGVFDMEEPANED